MQLRAESRKLALLRFELPEALVEILTILPHPVRCSTRRNPPHKARVRHHGPVRPCPRHGTAALASVVAALAVAATAAGADGTTTPAPPPCVAAAAVTIVEPTATAVTTVGPALAVASRTADTAPSFADVSTGLSLVDVQVGAEGCVTGSVPGGATVRSGAWSIFGGAVRGSSLRADLVPAAGDGSKWHLREKVDGLAVDGAAADPIAGASISVSDWAVLDVHATLDAGAVEPLRYWAAALELTLTRAHAGLPAGTRVLIGAVGADRPFAAPPPTVGAATTTTTTTTSATATTPPPAATTTTVATTAPAASTAKKPLAVRSAKPKAKAAHKPRAKSKRKPARPTTGQPLKGTPTLGHGSYVFPVDGRTAWGDTYGALRSDVPGGWHHGDDLFAALGTPVVAVADGIVFSVGWNRVGGWRLWLLDANGNQFYYCHLSGYTAAGSNDQFVHRGQVLGFVGNTGDAVTTVPHLHFEVHPSSTLYLGYDGAVDPTSYLRGWPLARNVVVPPPVELPSAAPPGRGSAVDFRRLLAVHPLRRPVRARPVASRPQYLGQLSAAAPAHRSSPTRPVERVASAAPGRATGGGDAAIVAGVLLALAALTALLLTARAGRSSSE